MKSVKIMNIPVCLQTKGEIIEAVGESVRTNNKLIVAYANTHAVNLAYNDPALAAFFQGAQIVYADGQGIRLACWVLGKELPPHMPLTQWVWDILAMCAGYGYSVFFLGSTGETLARAAENASRKIPRLTIAGCHHGFFEKTGPESDEVVETINRVSPDILFVGFGMPRQELWISENARRLNAHAILPAGSCIDVLAGRRWNVPRWARESGFEWFLRFLQEPGRLSGRYLVGNPLFLWRLVRECFHRT